MVHRFHRFMNGRAMNSNSDPSHRRKRWVYLVISCLIIGGLWQLVFPERFNPHPPLPVEQHSEKNNRYYLAAVIFNRVFKEDKFNITHRECGEWIEYMLNAGVEHIYWYDTAHQDAESQYKYFRSYIDSGHMTYHRFYHLFPVVEGSDFHYEQDNSYSHFLRRYNETVDWVIEMDVDEYPFSIQDTDPGFLKRYINKMEIESSSLSQVLLQCMMFLGNPRGEGWVIERYQRRKKDTEGKIPGFPSRHKPIFKAGLCAGVTNYDPHKFSMRSGTIVVADEKDMRMNHYWGPRITDFGPDTPELVQSLVEDSSIQPVVSQLKKKRLRFDH